MKRQLVQKGLVVNEIRDKLLGCDCAILTEYRGLRVADLDILRSRCRGAGVEYRVVKNTLTTLAVRETELSELNPYLVGPTAIGMSMDPIAAAKIMVEFAKEYPVFKIKAGVLKGRIFGPDGVKELATLPPREVLIARMLTYMKQPITGLLNTLNAPMRGLINLLKAITEDRRQNLGSREKG